MNGTLHCMLVPPISIFVDEAGSLAFREPKQGERKQALALVAVAVPTTDLDELRAILPRGSTGDFLKAQAKEFNRETALRFVGDLVASTAEVGAVLVDPGNQENIELVRERVRLANEGRARAREKEPTEAGKRQHPDITSHDLHYLTFLSMAVFECVYSWALRRREWPTSFDLFIDSIQIDDHQRTWFVAELRKLLAANGITVRLVEWRQEQDEPLLMLPDLVGGIICREDRYRDVGAPATELWDAAKAGRFRFRNNPPAM